jgi:YD repeat-containing protein
VHSNQSRAQVCITPTRFNETQLVDVPDSKNNAVSARVSGDLMTSSSAKSVRMRYDYDGLGRRVGETDPRTSRSGTVYDSQTA